MSKFDNLQAEYDKIDKKFLGKIEKYKAKMIVLEEKLKVKFAAKPELLTQEIGVMKNNYEVLIAIAESQRVERKKALALKAEVAKRKQGQ